LTRFLAVNFQQLSAAEWELVVGEQLVQQGLPKAEAQPLASQLVDCHTRIQELVTGVTFPEVSQIYTRGKA
jgi:hypothetical protein